MDDNSNVNIQIYNITGKLINTLIDQVQPSGWHSLQWNGKDQVGINVPAGAYLIRINAGVEVHHSKVILLK